VRRVACVRMPHKGFIGGSRGGGCGGRWGRGYGGHVPKGLQNQDGKGILVRMAMETGTDLIEIERIRAAMERHGERFLRRVFTAGEIAYCQRKKRNAAESYAGRFAAKEAAAKALGTGIARGVSWLEIEVVRRAGERPELRLTGRAAERAEKMGVRRMALSITHSRELAMAVVVMDS